MIVTQQAQGIPWRTGLVVTVIDHAAKDTQGQPKVREGCIVRILTATDALVYVPRYNAELWVNRETRRSPNDRFEVTV